MHIELVFKVETDVFPAASLLIPVGHKAVKVLDAIGRILDEEASGNSVFTISLYRQAIVVVELTSNSNNIFIVIIRKQYVMDLVLDKNLGKEWNKSPALKVMSLVR